MRSSINIWYDIDTVDLRIPVKIKSVVAAQLGDTHYSVLSIKGSIVFKYWFAPTHTDEVESLCVFLSLVYGVNALAA